MLLTDDEVALLTKRTRPHAQVRRLRELGIEHLPRPGETPAVLRSHVEHLLGGKTPPKVREPDFELDQAIMDEINSASARAYRPKVKL